MYEHRIRVRGVVNGQVVEIDLDIGFGISLNFQTVTIGNIDTPRCDTGDETENAFGQASKNRLTELLGGVADTISDDITLTTNADFYEILKIQINNDDTLSQINLGLASVDFILSDGRMVSEVMVEEGYAVPYSGGSTEGLAELHLANRERLISEGKVTL